MLINLCQFIFDQFEDKEFKNKVKTGTGSIIGTILWKNLIFGCFFLIGLNFNIFQCFNENDIEIYLSLVPLRKNTQKCGFIDRCSEQFF